MPENKSYEQLEALVVNNPNLDELESLLGQFNIFEAIGAERQELRHSDFLAFMLNPNQKHGLGDLFVKRFLQRMLKEADGITTPITPLNLDLWRLDHLQVRREHLHIDILLVDKSHHLAVIIENKIDSGEHSDQLQRYFNDVRANYPECEHIIGVYLTPDKQPPKDGEHYLPVSYSLVCEVLEDIASRRSSTLEPAVLTAINHYTQVLRRHIVEDSEIADLCRLIYREHKQAIDLINEHRPDYQDDIYLRLRDLIPQTPGMILDDHHKKDTHFAVQEWDVPVLMQGVDSTGTKRMLLFNFHNEERQLRLGLFIGPGPNNIRDYLCRVAEANQAIFQEPKALSGKWSNFLQIYSRVFLREQDYAQANDTPDLLEKIEEEWKDFCARDLPQIRDAFSSSLLRDMKE